MKVTQWTDSDEDGVGDNPDGADPDLCLETVVGGPVNDEGCSAIQRDTDNDEMNDAEDPCITSSANICRPNASGLTAIVWIAGTIVLQSCLGWLASRRQRALITLKFTLIRSMRKTKRDQYEVHEGEGAFESRGRHGRGTHSPRQRKRKKVIWKQAAPRVQRRPMPVATMRCSRTWIILEYPSSSDDGTVVNESGRKVSSCHGVHRRREPRR